MEGSQWENCYLICRKVSFLTDITVDFEVYVKV